MKSLKDEETLWRMKSRSLWLKVGDKNTSFFHKQEKARQWRNRVEEIKSQSGELISSFEEIKKETSTHFGNLYAKDGEDNQEKSEQFIAHIPSLVSEEDNMELNKVVSEEDIS
jgi:hypothetical protein